MRAPPSASAARSSRWTRWPATSPARCNRFFKDNLQADGRFKPADALRAEFEALRAAPAELVHQCGSGVTACHNLLAMEHAGLAGSRCTPARGANGVPTRAARWRAAEGAD